METIKDKYFEGERPLFDRHDLVLENVTFGTGESSLKRCANVVAEHCTFDGKYPFWHCVNFSLDHCTFHDGGRAALWYSSQCKMRNCVVEAPKMFRMMMGIDIADSIFADARETLWDCHDIKMRNVQMHNCDYLLMHSSKIEIDGYEHHGNYSFQYNTDMVIRNAKIYSKDAFWNTVDVTVYDSEIHGEYLGWYSKNLTLVNCHISGTQPLCYIQGLKLVNCTFDPDCDRAFEESDLEAEISSHVTSIVNPRHGHIHLPSVGQVIIDKESLHDSDCEIVVGNSEQ